LTPIDSWVSRRMISLTRYGFSIYDRLTSRSPVVSRPIPLRMPSNLTSPSQPRNPYAATKLPTAMCSGGIRRVGNKTRNWSQSATHIGQLFQFLPRAPPKCNRMNLRKADSRSIPVLGPPVPHPGRAVGYANPWFGRFHKFAQRPEKQHFLGFHVA
jgi:hypothetical protein